MLRVHCPKCESPYQKCNYCGHEWKPKGANQEWMNNDLTYTQSQLKAVSELLRTAIHKDGQLKNGTVAIYNIINDVLQSLDDVSQELNKEL